ncbi:hypothetical protein AALA36_09915 [Lachnospiraceae bacterium 66-29]
MKRSGIAGFAAFCGDMEGGFLSLGNSFGFPKDKNNDRTVAEMKD